jgi:hypothetical protein
MTERFLIKATYVPKNDDHKEKMIIVESVDGNVEASVIDKPKITFFMDKPDIQRTIPEMYVKKNEVNEFTVPYGKLINFIAEETGYKKWFERQCKRGNYSMAKRELMMLPEIHQADFHIEDFYTAAYYKKYKDEIIDPIADIFFFDTEVDFFHHRGGITSDGLFPTDVISGYSPVTQTIYAFVLELQDNKLIPKFKKEVESFRKEVLDRYKEEGVKDLIIKFYKDEIQMNIDFFHLINETLRPNYVTSWNLKFDFNQLRNRIEEITGSDPAEIMCPADFEYKNCYYYEDTRAKDFATKGDYAICYSYSNYIDQLLTFAGLRATAGKRDSYKLDDIAWEELKMRKDVLPCSIRKFSRHDFKKYVFYNIQDTMLIYFLERKNGDIALIDQLSRMSRTRPYKTWKKTISLKNLAASFMEEDGFILSNNRNVGKGKKVKFPGAFVLDPTSIRKVGMKIID